MTSAVAGTGGTAGTVVGFVGLGNMGHGAGPPRGRPAWGRVRFDGAHDLISKAWTAPEMFSWYGANYEYRYVNIWPRPVQQPHPPISIPGAGSSETMKFCAERKYTYMSVHAPARIVRTWFDGYRQAAADLGYVPQPEKIAFSVPATA